MNTKPSKTAYHEAGHVVAHLIFADDVPAVGMVTIVPDDIFALGLTQLEPTNGRRDPSLFAFDHDDEDNLEFSGFTQRHLEAKLCCLLAGEAATFICEGERDEKGTGREEWTQGGDFDQCASYLERVFNLGDDAESPHNRAAETYLDHLFWRTVCLLKRPEWWEKVEAIAVALMEKETLDADEIREAAFPNPL